MSQHPESSYCAQCADHSTLTEGKTLIRRGEADSEFASMVLDAVRMSKWMDNVSRSFSC